MAQQNLMAELQVTSRAKKTFIDLLDHERYGWGFMDTNNNLYLNLHGTSTGKMVGYGANITPEDLGVILRHSGLIDSNVKSIYTISCYGGLQKPHTMDSGITITSAHNSKMPILGGYFDGNNTIRFRSEDGSNFSPRAMRGIEQSGIIDISISADEFDEASRKYLSTLPKLTLNEAKQVYRFDEKLRIGEAAYYYSQGYSQKEFEGVVQNRIKEVKDNIASLNKKFESSSGHIKEMLEIDVKIQNLNLKLLNHELNPKALIGTRKLDEERNIIAQRYNKEQFWNDWERLSAEEKLEKYSNDYTKFRDERQKVWEERKREWEERKRQEALELERKKNYESLFVENEDGQIVIKDAQPSSKTPTVEKPSTPIKDEMTPSFVDKNGNIKGKYIYKSTRGPKLKENSSVSLSEVDDFIQNATKSPLGETVKQKNYIFSLKIMY